MLPLGELVAPPCQAYELDSQAWQRQPVPASWPRQCKWQMGWGPLAKKGGKGGEVACGSLIESRSGLSWWGGGDDREGRRAGVGEDYKATGSLKHPVGWPQALPLLSTPPLPPQSLPFLLLPFFSLPSFLTTKEPRREACLPGVPKDVWRLVKASFQTNVSKIDCIHS